MGRNERGASLVEFAVLMPLLLLLVLGIVELGWKFAQFNDVRHSAREGARFAAVDRGTVDDIRDYVCAALEGLDAGVTSVRIELSDGGALEGDIASISVEADVASLTGLSFFSAILPATISSDAQFRLEDDLVQWSANPPVQRSC